MSHQQTTLPVEKKIDINVLKIRQFSIYRNDRFFYSIAEFFSSTFLQYLPSTWDFSAVHYKKLLQVYAKNITENLL